MTKRALKKVATRATAAAALLLPVGVATTNPAGADLMITVGDDDQLADDVERLANDLIDLIEDDVDQVCREAVDQVNVGVDTFNDTVDTINHVVNEDSRIWALFDGEPWETFVNDDVTLEIRMEYAGDPCNPLGPGSTSVCYGAGTGTTYRVTGCIPID